MKAFLGIDVGTGSARAGLFDETGRIIGRAHEAIETYRPSDDFVEQSSDDIWRAVGVVADGVRRFTRCSMSACPRWHGTPTSPSVYLLTISNGAGSKVSNQPCSGSREALRDGSRASKSGSVASKSGFAILETVARVPQEWQGGRIARQPGVRLIHHRKGLALRNVKLRMSRKLLFASGLTSCFACELGIIENNCPKPRRPTAERCQECLLPMLQNPPLENLASAFLHVSGSAAPGLRSEIDESAAKAFSAYDEFVAMLADREKRRHLDDLEPTNFEEDSVFTEARTLSRQFRDALQYLFFDSNDHMNRLIRKYGVF